MQNAAAMAPIKNPAPGRAPAPGRRTKLESTEMARQTVTMVAILSRPAYGLPLVFAESKTLLGYSVSVSVTFRGHFSQIILRAKASRLCRDCCEMRTSVGPMNPNRLTDRWLTIDKCGQCFPLTGKVAVFYSCNQRDIANFQYLLALKREALPFRSQMVREPNKSRSIRHA